MTYRTFHDTASKLMAEKILNDLAFFGKPLSEYKKDIPKLVADGYLEHRQIVDALNTYKKEILPRLQKPDLLNDIYKQMAQKSMKKSEQILSELGLTTEFYKACNEADIFYAKAASL